VTPGPVKARAFDRPSEVGVAQCASSATSTAPSRQATTDCVLEALAHPSWREIETDWGAGGIQPAECMRSQVTLFGGSQRPLDAVLDGVQLDPGFVEFLP
jgi:hypothetical protein